MAKLAMSDIFGETTRCCNHEGLPSNNVENYLKVQVLQRHSMSPYCWFLDA